MRNVSLIEFDMESHYKDSLSTAIVNILLQCGFENSSKRALDELIGMSLNYMKNISLKISNLTNDCNLQESDVLIGLGALKVHGHNLDELFDFVQNYNDIFPPPPKTYFGPIPLKYVEPKKYEEKPLEIVSWAPDMAPSLATIGMKLKNRQIVSDPNFDRSNYLALSLNSPPLKNSEYRTTELSKYHNNSNSKIQKYGSNCSYELPPEAYPNKYEPPTIDLDSNGAVIGLNGKIGKLPDPFINDIEEQDLLRQKSKFLEIHQSKLPYSNHQLFNGVRQRKVNKCSEEISKRFSTPNRSILENINDEEMKENISKMQQKEMSPNLFLMTNDETSYKSNHQIDRNTTSDDVWNAALQATVESISKPDLPYITVGSVVTSNTSSIPVNNNDSLAQSIKSSQSSKRSKKHKRNSSFSSSRPKKIRKIEIDDTIVGIDSQVYKNESTMDSYVSDRSVPYSSTSDREPLYNCYDEFRAANLHEKSPSYSPINNFVPTNSVYYRTEIIPPISNEHTVTKSFKSKKKSSRKTHFSNKRKKKTIYTNVAVRNNFCTVNHHQLEDNSSNRMELNDNISIGQRSLSINYDRSNTPSPHPPMELDFEDSDDDRTEPMQESSEELIKMLEMTTTNTTTTTTNTNFTTNHQSNSIRAIELTSPPLQQIVNNNQNILSHMNNVIQDTQNQVGGNNSLSGGSGGGIRMKIKIRKNKNSVTRGPSSIVNSNTDLSSPIQSQHSDDKNSISERLQLMQYHSPLSDIDEACHPHSSFDKSSNHSNYEIQPNSPTYSTTQESIIELYRRDRSVASGAVSSTFSKPPTPNKLIIKPSIFNVRRFNSSSTHSSPKTLPALDDCDKIPPLQFKTNKSAKKRKRSRLSSGSKKVKSKKSVKLKSNLEEIPVKKPIEKPFVSVDDIFSDEEDNLKIEPNHINAVNARPLIPQKPLQQLPAILVETSPYRTPIPSIKITSKSSVKKSKSKSRPIVNNTPTVNKVETKLIYNYCCLQGEAYYKSEDGNTVYTCPICSTEDNGSLMLACDRCQDWYHGLCLGIFNPPPEDQDWFCPRCHEDKLSESLNMATTKSKSKSRTKKK